MKRRLVMLVALVVLVIAVSYWQSRDLSGGARMADVSPPPQESTIRTGLTVLDDVVPLRPDHDAAVSHSAGGTPKRQGHPFIYVNASIPLADLTGMAPANAAAVCELFLFGNPACAAMRSGQETFLDCVKRFGVKAWTLALQPQCTRSAFWKTLVAQYEAQDDGAFVPRFHELYDHVMEAHLAEKRRPRRPLTNRTYAILHPPLNCSYGRIYPFGFCASEEVMSTLPDGDAPPLTKVWDWFPQLPSYVPYHETNKIQKKLGVRPRYVSAAEDEYLHSLLYRLSYFAWTHARIGPDCQRHYDILASGCVPVFVDLPLMPPHRVSQLPRDVLLDVFGIPGIAGRVTKVHSGWGRLSTEYYFRGRQKQVNFRKLGVIDHPSFVPAVYHSIASKLRTFTKRHLSCSAMLSYALRVMNIESPEHVLFVGRTTIDYETIAVECGLFELGLTYTLAGGLGEHHQEHPRGPNVQAGHPLNGEEYAAWRVQNRLSSMYGRNFHVGRRIPPPPPERQLSLSAMCEVFVNATAASMAPRFDLVLYSHPLLGTAGVHCADEVARHVAAGNVKVAVFDGGDAPATMMFPGFVEKGFYVFSREASC